MTAPGGADRGIAADRSLDGARTDGPRIDLRLSPARLAARPLAILGPTASGKSSLALALVRALAEHGAAAELVSIDSMQVYEGMDIGTATPARAEQEAVRHHLIDVVSPTDEFTVGAFQGLARAAIADVRSRGAVPILVGGTGLYLRSVIDDLDIPPRFPDILAELRRELDGGVPVTELHDRLARLDPEAAARMEPTNERRILRALEVTVGSGRAFSSFGPGLEAYPPTSFVQVALRWSRAALDDRIEARYQAQMEAGFLDEVRWLRAVGPSRTAAQALGYRELLRHLDGELTLDEALLLAVTRTRQFARRQDRWFRRDPRIEWIDAPPDPSEVLARWVRAAG